MTPDQIEAMYQQVRADSAINLVRPEQAWQLIEAMRAEMGRLREDVERWAECRTYPDQYAHLIGLLARGKGTADDLDKMVDRIIKSRAAEKAARRGAP